MNKKTIFIILIAAIAITMFNMTSFAYGQKQGNFAGKPGTSFGFSGQDRHPGSQFDARSYQSGELRGIFNLDLSVEQLTEIKQMMLDFQKETLEFRNQIQAKKLEIKEMMLESSLDMDQVRVKMEEIAQLQVELRMKAFERQDKVKEVLTPEQLESFGLGSPMQKFGMGNYNCKEGFKGSRW